MESILIFIKHHFGFLWKIIEVINDRLFSILNSSRIKKTVPDVIREFSKNKKVKVLSISDVDDLHKLINSQKSEDLKYFQPHGFDIDSLKKQAAKRSFLMMGIYEGDKLTGYFFLRFFFNGKCFVGRLIDKEHRGKGLGNIMNDIMYNIAWRMNFRCLSTISKHNKAVVGAHKKNSHMKILKELPDDYLLVEFVESSLQ